MRFVICLLSVIFLTAGLVGCGSNIASDSVPPPGVRKNENRNTGVNATKKGKAFMLEQTKRKP
jgi:hypothetical protein